MQALAERLDARLAGSLLERIEVLGFSALKTVTPSPEDVTGKVLREVRRRGKFLVLSLDGGERILVHLSQGGRIDVEEPPKATRPRGSVVRFVFAAHDPGGGPVSILVKEFGKERKAAWWVMTTGYDGPLGRLGPEVDDPAFDELILRSEDRRRVHTLLRDQRTVAGIGRGYSDDALHEARLSPFATLPSLGQDERKNLLAAIRSVLASALEGERERSGGLPPKLGDRFRVHGRHGTPCPRCSTRLERVSYEAYEITYCPACQTGGKVLADRRLSRLLR